MTLANSVSTVLMMRTLRAVISCMLRSIVALLNAPATRGSALVAASSGASPPRSSPSM